MRTIFKYPIEVADVQVVRMPAGATLLDVQLQRGEPCIWALVDDELPSVSRRLLIVGTGHKLDSRKGLGSQYVGTFQTGVFVFHLFDLGETQ